MKYTIKDLPESERPYEKCIREGEEALSDSELLADPEMRNQGT